MPITSYAIVVEVDNAEPNCLIEIPYAREFNPVSQAIQAAAQNVHLRPVRVDQLPKGSDFPQQVVALTRSARLVVAVCSPVGGQGASPNANVLVETGLALALGKPTLILTTDLQSIPADIRHLTVLTYRTRDPALVTRIENEMRNVLASVKDGLIRSDCPGIWVATARNRMLLRPEFWKSFGKVLNYASSVRNEMESSYRDFIHDVEGLAKEIVDTLQADSQWRVARFRSVWRKYAAHYVENTQEVLEAPEGFKKALDALDRLTAAGSDTREQIVRIDRYSTLVQFKLENFRRLHTDMAATCEAFLKDSSCEDSKVKLRIQVSEFADSMKGLITYSGGLVNNMVNLVSGSFEEASPPPAVAAASQGGD